MAESRDLLFRFLGDARDLANASRQAKTSLSGVDSKTKTTSGGFKGMAANAKLAAIGAGALVTSGLVRFLGDAAQAALEDEASQRLLKTALENTVGATDEQVQSTEEFIDATSRATGVADDELRPALGELLRATGDLDEAQDLLGGAMDIAAAKGLPLESVTRAIGKAAGGSIGAMARLGIKVRDAEGNFLDLDGVMAEANRTMGGATAAAADTVEGKLRRMNVAVDEAKESIGNALLPIIEQAADTLSNMDQVLGFVGDKLENVPGPTGKVVGEVKKLIGPLGLVNAAWGLAAEQVEKITDRQKDLEAPLKVGRDRFDEMSATVDEARESLEEFEDEVRSQMDPMFNLVDAVNDLDDAQRESGEARDEYGEGSAEHREALRKEAEKWLAVRDAQVKAAEESGVTRDKFKQNLKDMGIFTDQEIDLMLDDFDRVNDYKFTDKTIRVNLSGRGADTFADTVIGRKAAGGPTVPGGTYVVGERGPELLSMGSRGGHITPNHALRSPAPAPAPTNIYVSGFVGSEARLAAEIDRVLTLRARRSGLGFQP